MSGTIQDVRLRMIVPIAYEKIWLQSHALAYWNFEEASGTRVDATGRGTDLSPANDPSAVSGKVGNAVQFVSTGTQYLRNGAASGLMLGEYPGFYIAFWIKVLIPTAYDKVIFCRDTNQNPYVEVQGTVFGTAPIQTEFAMDGDTTDFVDLVSDEWNFYEAYYEKSNQGIYIAINHVGFSGFPINDPDYTPSPLVEPFTIGAKGFGQYPSDCLLDEFGIYSLDVFPPPQNIRDYLWNNGDGRTLYP